MSEPRQPPRAADTSVRRNADRRARRWGRARLRRFGWPLALVLGSGLSGPALAQTLPQGGSIVGGSGAIQYTNPNLLTIQQGSDYLAIDWQSFSVGAGQTVRFVQPSSSALALNRVVGADPSQIFGQIQANGRVILLNPNGIYFGPSSHVDVNALIATTAGIRTDEFMAGTLRFDQASANADARVVNAGLVSVAHGGFAVLAAAAVENTGRIVANGGTVVLAGTPTFAVDFHGDGLLNFAATGLVDRAPAGAAALVDNSGAIDAAGGRVLLTARAARDVLDNVINTSGIVVATTAQMVNGEIVIDGGDNGIVNVSGMLDASGRGAGETGGTVKVLGEKVALLADSRIDAAGDRGGGTVLVGGNYQGQGPEPNARMVYMDARAVIDASATAQGDGGRVILWADETTRFDGTILARAGLAGGDGGFVETSGKIVLRVGLGALVDASAPAGANGTWLLDPNNISIVTGAGASTNISGNPSFLSTDDNAQIYDATINTALDAGNNVTVTTGTGGTDGQTGIITVSGDILNSTGGARTLTLTAVGAINITGTIGGTSGNALSVVLDAPTGAVAIGGTIDPYGGSLTINAGTAVTQTAGVVSSSGTLPLFLNLTGTATAGLTNISNNFFQITLNSTSSGAINITTQTTPQLQTSSIAGDLTLNSNSGFIQAGALTATGGGTVTLDGGTGNVTLSYANVLSGDFNVTGQVINVTAAQSTTGNVSFVAASNVGIGGDISSGGGDIFITGNVASWTGPYAVSTPVFGSSTGTFTGVAIAAGADIDAGGGSIAIAGKGGTTGLNQNGISMGALSTISTTGSGAIALVGMGGPSTSDSFGFGGSHNGLFPNGGSGGNEVDISTVDGDIRLVGTGGGSGGATDNNNGVILIYTKVRTTGLGWIDIEGTSGVGASRGIFVGLGASEISTASGSIALTGVGGTTQTTGAGFVNAGIQIQDAVVGPSVAGSLSLHGIEGADGSGISLSGTNTLGNAGLTGDITFVADSIALSGATSILAAGAGALYFETDTPTTSIGVAGGAGTLQITSALLAGVSGFADVAVGVPGQLGDIAVGAASLGASLSLVTDGAISFSGNLGLSGGDLLAEAGAGISVTANVTTGGGDITLWGNSPGGVAGGTTPGTFFGVYVDAATVDAGGGNIEIVGTGSAADYQHGVTVRSGGGIVTSGTGTIDITGQGGGSTNGLTVGVEFFAGGAYAQTQHGALNVTGYGGTGGGHANQGVALATGEIRATGTGAVTVTGVGGVGGSTGVQVGGGGTTRIASVDGDVTIDATGGSGDQAGTLYGASHSWGVAVGSNSVAWFGTIESTGAGNVVVAASAGASSGDYRIGALVLDGGIVRATGTGNVSVVGAGGTGSGTFNDGVMIANGTVATQGSGDVTVRGLASLGTGIVFAGTTATLGDAAMTGDLTLRADSFDNTAGTLSILGAGGGGTVTFRTESDTTTIGVAGGTGTAQITAAMIAAVGGFEQVHIGFPSQTGAIDTGPLTMTRNLWLQTAGTITTGTLTMGAYELDVANGGAFTQTGALTSTGLVKFSDAGDVTATHASNAFEYLEIDKNNPANVTIVTTMPLDLSYVTMDTGALSITAPGITQLAPMTTNGTAFFDGGSGSIALLDPGNSVAGAVRFATTGAGNVTFMNALPVQFGAGATTVGGDLEILAGGAITQVGDIAVGGYALFDGFTGAITLNNAGNAVAGDVAFASIGGAVTWREAGAVTIGMSNSGSMNVQAGGAITQTGGILTGAASFDADANAITLADGSNVFTGAVTLATTGAADASLAATGPVELAASSVGGNLTIAKFGAGDVTQSGPLNVGGNLSANAGGGLILLNQGANSIAGTVSLDSTGAGTNAFQNGAPLALGTLAVTGNLDVTANTGAITQTAAMTVGGDASFTAGAFTITLTDPANLVGGSVVLANTGGNAVAWTEAGAVSLGASTTGNLTIDAAGAVTQAGALAVTGNLAVSTTTGAITLTNAANAVSGDVAITGGATGDVAWTEAGAVQLGATTAAGNLTVLAGGAITQSAAIAATGVASFTTGAAAITLADPTNMFGGLALSNSGANAVDVQATGLLDVVSAAVGSGALSLSATGALTQSGAILQSGAGALALTGGSVALNNGGNVLLGAVTLSATSGNAALANSVATDIASVASSGDFVLISGGNVTQSGAISVAAGGDSGVLASGSVITLTNVSNDFGDSLTLSGASGAIDGTIATLTGAPAAAFATATSGTFLVNGATVTSTPPPPATTTTAAVLNEISSVAPLDTAVRIDAPPVVGGGFSAPSIQASLSLSTADLGGGTPGGGVAGGGTAQAGGGAPGGPADETAGPVFAPAPTPAAPAGAGPQADGPAPTVAADAPRVVLSEPATPAGPGTPAAGGGGTVRATPAAPTGGPVTLVPGLLVQGAATGSGPAPAGTSTFSQSWPQNGNFQ
jgi:filamentous hemagglutinin family protein